MGLHFHKIMSQSFQAFQENGLEAQFLRIMRINALSSSNTALSPVLTAEHYSMTCFVQCRFVCLFVCFMIRSITLPVKIQTGLCLQSYPWHRFFKGQNLRVYIGKCLKGRDRTTSNIAALSLQGHEFSLVFF